MNVRELREKTGMTRQEFADYLSIPKGTIRNWEQGIVHPTEYMVSFIEKILIYEGKIRGHTGSKQ